jgi:6-phosphogluconate dehydrogenase
MHVPSNDHVDSLSHPRPPQGIEYGDMQLICEAYDLLRRVLGMSNSELSATFDEWNKGDLESYLIEISRDIFSRKEDDDASKYVVDSILDAAGQKGTGKWTAIAALDLGMPLTLIGEAVFARCLSAQKDERVAAAAVLPGPPTTPFVGDRVAFIAGVRDALYAAKLVSYAQGFVLIRAAAKEYKWKLDCGPSEWWGGLLLFFAAAFDALRLDTISRSRPLHSCFDVARWMHYQVDVSRQDQGGV